MERRDLLKAGLYGFSGLSLGDLLRQRAFAIDHAAKPGDAIRHSCLLYTSDAAADLL